MTNKDAFVSGVQLFCKSAGFDGEDAKQVERLLLMHPDEAKPIIKAASVNVKRIEYVRAGTLLEKCAEGGVQIPPAIMQALGSGDYQSLINWAQQQQGTVGSPGPTGATGATAESSSPSIWGVGRAVSQLAGGLKNMFGIGGNPPGGANAQAGSSTIDGAANKNDKTIAQWDEEFESKYKNMGIPKPVYDRLRNQYDLYSQAGRAMTPLDDFLQEQWAGERYSSMQRLSRNNMRRYGVDMAPGQLAQLTDEQIAARTKGIPGADVSLRRARDMAAQRQQLQGGVGARMGTGFSTGNSAMTAASQTPAPAAAGATATGTSASAPAGHEAVPSRGSMSHLVGPVPGVDPNKKP